MTALDFVRWVLAEQLAHGDHGDQEYIRLAQEILAHTYPKRM